MSKGQFYLTLSVLVVASPLFVFKIQTIGNEDILGGLIVCFASFIVLYLAYLGYRLFKWVGIIGFSILASGTLLATIENEDYSFLFLTLGYSYLVWKLIRIKSSQSSDTIQHVEETRILPPNTFVVDENHYKYPLLLRRYQSLFIDGMLLLFIMIIVMVLTEKFPNAITIRITVSISMALLYEPLLTAYSSTVGQKMMGIRVRDARDPSKRINLVQSYFRCFTKGFLGWLSFVTIHFNPEHRAIHDLVASSVMIKIK